MYPIASGTGVRLTGTWDWRDDFVGQGDPFDVAALQFTADCFTELGWYEQSAATWDGTPTAPPTLRSSGVGSNEAVWNVDARPVGFENLADNGVVSVIIDAYTCEEGARLGGAFAYEANVGGSLTGVSVGWGFLSVSYSGGTDSSQLSTEPIYRTVLRDLVSTATFYAGQPRCIEAGREGIDRGSWFSYKCVRTSPTSDLFELFVDASRVDR